MHSFGLCHRGSTRLKASARVLPAHSNVPTLELRGSLVLPLPRLVRPFNRPSEFVGFRVRVLSVTIAHHQTKLQQPHGTHLRSLAYKAYRSLVRRPAS